MLLMKRRATIAAAIVILVLGLMALPRAKRYIVRERVIAEQQDIVVPPAERPASSARSVGSTSSVSSARSVAASSAMRAAVNWDVPFTSQAPHANWDALHEEACEEASVLMVVRYFQGTTIASPDDAEAAIQKLVADNEALGFQVDDTAAQIIQLLAHEDPSLTAVLLRDPTALDLKSVLSEGKLVIVPAAGRQLENPYFSGEGPVYHMLVLRGYTENGYAITNDPGTKRGRQYAYSWDVLLNAIHDWNGGDVENGEKVVVVVSNDNEE